MISKLGLLIEGTISAEWDGFHVFSFFRPNDRIMFASRRPKRTRSERSQRDRSRFAGSFLRIKRRATATAEVAICLPVLMTLTLATIDLCSMFFLKETVAIAAYEGARRGVNRGGTNAAVRSRVLEFLDERGIEYGANVVQFDGTTFDNAETLEHVTLVVTVPAAGNLLSPAKLYGDLSLTSRVSMRKEFANQD